MAPHGSDRTFVEFERVQKSYDGIALVVKDLNLAIARGEFLTMLGPSGSGKTTCLMMLAASRPPPTARSALPGARSTWCRRTGAGSAWCFRTTPCFRT